MITFLSSLTSSQKGFLLDIPKSKNLTLYSTRREGNSAALINMLFETTRKEADADTDASESFILVTSMVLVVIGTSCISLKRRRKDKRKISI